MKSWIQYNQGSPPKWLGVVTGLFSVKSAYLVLKQTSDMNSPKCSNKSAVTCFRRKLWRLKVQEKVKVFIWRLYHNFLPVGTNLLKRGIASTSQCWFCKFTYESSVHIFLDCWWSNAFWKFLNLEHLVKRWRCYDIWNGCGNV